MPYKLLPAMIVSLLLFSCGGVLSASEADELREHAKVLRKKSSISAQQGNLEQAEVLERESAELMAAAERLDLKSRRSGEFSVDKEARQLKERLQDLLAKEQKLRDANATERDVAEVREQIARTERELHTIHTRHDGLDNLPPEFQAQARKLEMATRRIHHFRVAAENLKIADAHDLAHQLMEKAEAMERDVREGKKRLAAEIQKAQVGEHDLHVVRGMKEEIEQLRAEVRELRQKLENR